MKAEHRHPGRARLGDLGQQRVEVFDRVGQSRQHRRDHDVTAEAGLTDGGDQSQTCLRRRRAGLDVLVQFWIADRQRHRDADVDLRAASVMSGRSRRSRVPLVRMENGVPESASAPMMPGISA